MKIYIMFYKKNISYTFLFCFFLLFTPFPAYALQTHGGIEGLYAHQGAHIFFFLAMVIFALRIYKSELILKGSWRYLSFGIWLLAFWNLWAFTGHILALSISKDQITTIESLKTPKLIIYTWKDALYYILKMDHLLCLPAIVLLYLGLTKMLNNSLVNKKLGNNSK